MTIEEKLKITIRIAGIPDFALTIKRSEEEYYRAAVRDVNKLLTKWQNSTNTFDSDRIFAIIAIMFAKQSYETLAQKNEIEENFNQTETKTLEFLEDFEKELDRILFNVK